MNTTRLGVQVHWCKTNDHAGLTLMERNLSTSTKVNAPGTQDVYRVRMVGPTVELLSVSYCSSSLALAPYRLSHAGSYTVEVLHLHSNYSLQAPSPVHKPDDLSAASFQLETLGKPARGSSRSQTQKCRDLDAPGKWLYEEQPNSLNRTCVHEDYKVGCLPLNMGTDRYKSGLTWWQPHCEQHEVTTSQFRSCLGRRKLCMFGDSHMRFLFNFVYDLVEGSWTTEITPGSKEIRSSDMVAFYEDPWGWAVHEEEHNCSMILRNTGAWHISYAMSAANGRRPPDLADYAGRVSHVAASMHAARERGAQVIWMTTNGQPINLAVHTHEKFENKDYRTDPMLLALNRVANRAMAAHDIPIYDTWSMTSAVADTAFDGAHFVGDVGFFSDSPLSELHLPFVMPVSLWITVRVAIDIQDPWIFSLLIKKIK